jgi:hypothetical protein
MLIDPLYRAAFWVTIDMDLPKHLDIFVNRNRRKGLPPFYHDLTARHNDASQNHPNAAYA